MLLPLKSSVIVILIATITANGQIFGENVFTDIKTLLTEQLQNLNNTQETHNSIISDEICLNHFLEILNGLKNFEKWSIQSNF